MSKSFLVSQLLLNVIQDLAKQWAKVDDKGREKYQKEAAKLKAKYDKDMAAYGAAT